MKNLLFALVSLCVLVSCDDDEIEFTPAVGAGRYTFESPDVEFGFEMIHEHSVYKGVNGWVDHPAITATEGRDNIIVTRYGSARDTHREIMIRAADTLVWSVRMLNTRFTTEGMEVGEMRVLMPGQAEVVLTDQFIEK